MVEVSIRHQSIRGSSVAFPTHVAPARTMWFSEQNALGDTEATVAVQIDSPSGDNWIALKSVIVPDAPTEGPVVVSDVTNTDHTTYDTVLTIPLAANTTYVIPLDLAVTTPETNNSIDLALDVPSGATGTWSMALTTGNTMALAAGDLSVALNGTYWGSLRQTAENVCAGLIRIVTTSAGNLVVKHRRTSTTGGSSVTVKAGSRGTLYASPNLVVLAADFVNSTSTPAQVYSVSLPQGTHLIEVGHKHHTGNASIDVVYQYGAINGSFIALNASGSSSAASHGDVRTDATATLATGIQTVGAGCLKRILVTIGAGGGAFQINARSENISFGDATIYAGGFLWHRPVTLMAPASSFPVANTSDTVPTAVFTFPVTAGKKYVATIGMALTTNATSTGQGVATVRSGGETIFAPGFFNPASGTSPLSGRVLRDDDIEVAFNSVGATEAPACYRMHIEAGGSNETPSIAIRREAIGSGDCTAERGFAILEEVA